MVILKRKKKDYKILVVDDAQASRDLYKAMLDGAGYTVSVAGSGSEGLKYLENNKVDLVLCDYEMPDINGEKLLKKVRSNPELQHIVVIMITANESHDVRVMLLKTGANDFVQKGTSSEELIARVNTHLIAIEMTSAKSILDVAGEHTNKISQPLAVLMGSLDVLEAKLNQFKSDEEREDLKPLVKNLQLSVNEMAKIIEQIRLLGISTTKFYAQEK